MSDRIWILGPLGSWHETTIEAIDIARKQDRQVAVSCNKLVSVHSDITISTEEPVTGVCGGCFIKMVSPMGDLKAMRPKVSEGFNVEEMPPVNLRGLVRSPHAPIAQTMGRHLLDQSWHESVKVIDVNLLDLSVP